MRQVVAGVGNVESCRTMALQIDSEKQRHWLLAALSHGGHSRGGPGQGGGRIADWLWRDSVFWVFFEEMALSALE